MEQNLTENDIQKIIDKKCCDFLNSQRNDIIANIRAFSKYDGEIQYFLDRVTHQIKDRFEDEKDEVYDYIKTSKDDLRKYHERKLYESQTSMDRHLKSKIESITEKQPYDAISKEFLDGIQKDWIKYYQKNYGSSINDLRNELYTCFFFMVIMFGIGVYFLRV